MIGDFDTQIKPTKKEDTKAGLLKGPLFITIVIILAFSLGYSFAVEYGGGGSYISKYTIPGDDVQNISGFDSKLYAQVYGMLKESYVDTDRIDDKKLFYGALKGMVNAVGDPYTSFFDPETNREFNEELSGQFEGIGAEIGIREGRLTVIAPLAGSPAEKAGLRAQDLILSIDQKDTSKMDLDEAIAFIRGKAGTTVTLTIYREGNGNQTKDIVITRDKIIIPTSDSEVRDGIGILRLYNFNSESDNQFVSEVMKLRAENIRGLVLDLRNNPGGFLDRSVTIASAWLDEGDLVVREVFRDSELNQEYRAARQISLPDVPTVVLVNEGSASASEILAGALQDHKKATIIGTKTYGKGSIQDLQKLPDGSGLKITIAQWVTPNGRIINMEGIVPDIEIQMTVDDYVNNRDPQLDRAFEFINNT